MLCGTDVNITEDPDYMIASVKLAETAEYFPSKTWSSSMFPAFRKPAAIHRTKTDHTSDRCALMVRIMIPLRGEEEGRGGGATVERWCLDDI